MDHRTNAHHTHGSQRPRITPSDGSRERELRQLMIDGLAYNAGGERPTNTDALGYYSPLRAAEELFSMRGVDTRTMTRPQLARAAMATADFSDIIATVAARSLVRGYTASPRTFVGVFRKELVKNFKPVERVRLDDMPALLPIAEGATYTEAALGEGKETYTVAKYGRRIGYTWEMLLNDDVGALGRIPEHFGAAAARLESDIVWAILTANGNLSDAAALFNVTAGNESVVVLDAPGLAAARKHFRERTAPNGQKLNIAAEFLIVGPELETTAELLLAVLPELAATSRDAIVAPGFRRSLKLVVEPRITDTNWYLAASSQAYDTVEYAFLEGGEEPTITRESVFDSDVLNMKVRHVVGAGAVSRDGLFHSTGAGEEP